MAALIPRMHLFEFEDQAWFPSSIRNYMTDFLRYSTVRMQLHRPMVQILTSMINRTGTPKIVDLCSGGGGLLAAIQRDIRKAGRPGTSITFTDKYPNAEALSAICREQPSALQFEVASVDATAVPARLRGIRTMFSAFHHFRPEIAQQILGDSAASGQGIAVFEISRRSILGLVPMLLSPLGTWLMTPFIRPLTPGRLFFTYVVPLVPFFVMWDGIVSAFRTYTVDEMKAMVAGLGGNTLEWEAGIADAPFGYKVTYLVGVPR
ncbi:hypothetical protein ACFOKI_14720 [Sphingomonas qilianensis]|uniref:Class I SAM-dependent methyltransferase n=1 Tax=Sphingomonas qilianensis TaxID=1736690 RepID=A0ABU9XMH4_9SPHN